MPEMPEVETVRRGLIPHWVGRRISFVDLRRPDLRFPFPSNLEEALTGAHNTTQQRITRSLFAAYTLNLVRHRSSSIAAPKTSARELVRVEIRVFWLVFCNYGLKCCEATITRATFAGLTAWPAKSLSRGRSAVPFLTVGLPRPAGGNFVARRSRSPCLPRRPRLRRSCS